MIGSGDWKLSEVILTHSIRSNVFKPLTLYPKSPRQTECGKQNAANTMRQIAKCLHLLRISKSEDG